MISTRLKLILITILFCSPVLAGYILFHSHYHSQHTTNHGQLIQPVIAWDQLHPAPLQPNTTPKAPWTLAVYISHPCGTVCEHKLYDSHQLLKSMGKYQDQVDIRFLVADNAAAFAQDFQEKIPAKLIYQIDAEVLSEHDIVPGMTVILDDQQRLLLAFPEQQPLADIKTDLKKLIKNHARPS